MNNTMSTVSLFQTLDDIIVNFTFESDKPHVYPEISNVNFSFSQLPTLDFSLYSSGVYEPPIYKYTDFSTVGDSPYIPKGVYKPPIYKFVNVKFDSKAYTAPSGSVTNFGLSFEPACKPDYTDTDPLAAVLNFVKCTAFPDGQDIDPLAAIINFDCCVEKKECQPDFVEQIGSSVIIDIDSCSGDPDFIEQTGNFVTIDINCCEDEAPVVDPVFASGDIKLDSILIGEAIHDLMFTLTGNIRLDPVVMESEADRGAQVIGNIALQPVVVKGEAIHSAESYTLSGNIKLDVAVKGIANYYEIREAYGNIQLPLSVAGLANVVPIVIESDILVEDIKFDGKADFELIEVKPSNIVLEPVIIDGSATYNIVPTATGKIPLDVKIQGDLLYIDLPTAWGDIPLEVEISSDANMIAGVHVYWANLILPMEVSGYAETPIYVEESNIVVDDIQIKSNVIVAAIVAPSDIEVGNVIFNRGWVEFGDPLPPVIREMYEASNVRSDAIKEYPVEAKYPIYVPTTDYSVKDVQFRRGTVDYTIEFDFDAIHVEKIVVWIVDEDGNAVIDQVAKWLNGDVENHVINRPFKYVLSIPIHCVNDKKYEFMLEVVYDEGEYNNIITRPKKSFFVPFQAHFDNRNPYFNATDRVTSLDAGYGSNASLETSFTDFSPITETFEESGLVHISNAENIDSLKSVFFELSLIEWRVSEVNNVGFGVSQTLFKHDYYELDVGQIGG